MAADVAEFLRKKFLTDFEEAKESTELSPGNPLLPHLENAKHAVEEISTIYITSSSATLVRLQPPLYLVNNVLAECRIFELQWNDPTKSLVRFNFFTKLYFNFRIRRQLGTAQKALESIINLKKHTPSIRMPFTTAQSYPSTSASVVNDSEIFGFDGHAQCIENLLLGDKTSDGFIAAGVVGMGGTGKNTLVGKVLSSPRICNEFFPRIQVSLSAILSDGGDTRRIIGLQLLRELSYNDLDESLGSLELLEVLKKQLLGKKYLIVLNDVWHENEWYANLYSEQLEGEIFEDRLSHGLPKGGGGAVIVTSRLEHVARSMVGGKNLFRLKPSLHWKDSYKILTKHINEDQLSKDKYNMFSKIKYEVVDQCHGLPLAAEIIARFISSGGIAGSDGGKGWHTVEKRFIELTATDGVLPRSHFANCIGMRESREFAEELFDMLARRLDISENWITRDQLKEFWNKISDQSLENNLHLIFDIMDKDGDGKVNRDEVRKIISLCASANKLSRMHEQAEEYAALIMEELDPDNHGYITIDSLETLQSQALSESPKGDDRHLNRMLSQKLMSAYDTKLWYFMLDNWQKVWVIALWIGVMSGLFGYKYFQYRQKDAAYQVMGSCMCIAKGAAETLKLNMALVLLPICRNTITWLRNTTKLGYVIPFADNINFHGVIAIGIAVGAGIHGVVHLACIFPRLLHASSDNYELVKPFFGKGQPRSYWHFVKSVEGVTGITMVVLMAIAFTLATPWFRRGRLSLPRPFKKLTGFNAFWYSHHLFAVVYALLLVHGIYLYLTHEWYKKTTWMYLAVPLTLYGSERLFRALRSNIKTVSIFKVVVYPGNVLALHMSNKPQGFRYKSGQYMLVNCAAVSPFEWHPFYMTSSPGDDYLSFHIRTLGDWTRQLKTVFSEVCVPPANGRSGLLRAECLLGEINPVFPKVSIDGPYGAPAQDYKKYEVVLLVGLGIGITPMISIVKEIVNNMKAMDEVENELEKGDANNGSSNFTPTGDFKTRRAYFYWVTRDQGSFDWFKNVMNEVAELDHKGVIEMHNYCTSVYEESDARSAFLVMLQSIIHARNGLDVVSSTHVKTHFARPNWRNVYKRIALNHTNTRVGVFYCGAPIMATELKKLALDFSHKTSTKFDFHEEVV